MKPLYVFLVLAIVLGGCSTPTPPPTPAALAATDTPMPTATEAPPPTATPPPPTRTPAPTNTPLPTPTPTITLTPTPKATPFGGSAGYALVMIDDNLVKVSLKDPSDFDILVSADDLESGLEIKQFSSLRTNSVSHDGQMVAYWNCASKICDTERGTLYLFSPDFKQKTSIDIPGYPDFIGWSKNHDRLLYYLGSTMSDDYYIVKTKDPGFGEVVKLGRLTDATWTPDGQTIYGQMGAKIFQYDKDGKQVKELACNFNNACAHALSPDGKHFAAIQRHLPSASSNPRINITHPDFADKSSLTLKDDHAAIWEVVWQPDSQHVVAIGESSKQSNRRYFRLDYLSVIDVNTGEERVINLNVPADAESFRYCGTTPDLTHMVYLGTGGRVKEGGRLYYSGRYIYLLPISAENPQLKRLTQLEDVWESCPAWLE